MRKRGSEKPTDRATDGNHLQMTAFEPPLQGGVCGGIGGAFGVEDFAIGADGAFAGDVGIGVALEGVPDATTEVAL